MTDFITCILPQSKRAAREGRRIIYDLGNRAVNEKKTTPRARERSAYESAVWNGNRMPDMHCRLVLKYANPMKNVRCVIIIYLNSVNMFTETYSAARINYMLGCYLPYLKDTPAKVG